MAIKLYPLRNVPEDEVEEMRELLRTHEIDFHETDAGFFGIGTAAIWIQNPEQLALAQSLIEQYQQARYTSARERYAEGKSLGQQIKFIDLLRQNPVKVVLYIVIALLLLLLMAKPFWF